MAYDPCIPDACCPLSEIFHAKCTIILPIEIVTSKKPHPKGVFSMSVSQNGVVICLWRYKTDDIYEKVQMFYISDTKMGMLLGGLHFLKDILLGKP